MSEIQFDIFGGSEPVSPPVKTEEEARIIPSSVAVCPICWQGLWIESIDEVVELECGNIVPSSISLTCETEPPLDLRTFGMWEEWYKGHYSMPYIDWLPVENKVQAWLEEPAQQKRVTLIWRSGAMEAAQ